jgi:hypothetical protein
MKPSSPRRRMPLILSLLALASLAALAAPSAAVKPKPKKKAATIRVCANKRTGAIKLARKGRRCGKRARLLTWNVRGPRGPKGPSGGTGVGGRAAALAIFTSRAGNYVSATMNPGYASVSGPTVVTATESLAQTLAPAAPFVASRLAVRATAAPGAGNTVTVTLRDEGADTPLSCTIADVSTTCSNQGASALITGSSALSLEISSTGTVSPLSLFVGFQGR